MFLHINSDEVYSNLDSKDYSFAESTCGSFIAVDVFSVKVAYLGQSGIYYDGRHPMPGGSEGYFKDILQLGNRGQLPVPPPVVARGLSLLIAVLLVLGISTGMLRVLRAEGSSDEFCHFFHLFLKGMLRI